MTRLMAILALALSGLLMPNVAMAANCEISGVTPLEFLAVDTLGGGKNTTADISITCSEVNDEQVTMCIALGDASSQTDGPSHILSSGGSQLLFGLYTNETGGTRWGSDAKPETGSPYLFRSSANDGGLAAEVRVYGIVPGGQAMAATGGYSSSVPVSVSYLEGNLADCASLSGAPSVTSALSVTAQVEPNCLIEADDINFGTVGIIDAPLTAQGGLDVTCTPGAAYTISMGQGNHYQDGSRHMSSGTGMISYGLFHDEAGGISWDTPFEETATGNDDQPVWGRVLPQPASPGDYSDTVTVTINYQ